MAATKICAFCGRDESDVRRLIKSPDKATYICDACVVMCLEILEEEGMGRSQRRLQSP